MHAAAWQAELAAAFRHPADLLDFLNLDAQSVELSRSDNFAFLVTRSYAERMVKGNPNDPLLRQVLPLALEQRVVPGYLADPVGDHAALAVPGVLHKYQGRALLLTTGACAIHCRYCFRRAFPYSDTQLSGRRQQAALDYLAADPTLREVILSGGDPLLLSDARLFDLFDQLAAIPHLQRLRIHSRVPLVLPSRLTAALIERLAGLRLSVVLVLHANHAHELGGAVPDRLAALRARGLTLLNQSVLLAGINDNLTSLKNLSERLFECGVLPYYLHILDKALGTAHFEVSTAQAQQLHRQLREQLPGYLVPRLVREQAGAPFKLPLDYDCAART